MSSVGGDDVLAAVLSVLRQRLPSVLAQLNAVPGAVVQLDPVHVWRIVADFDERRVDGQLPQIAVDSPGLASPPGRSSLAWTVVATVLQRGPDTTKTAIRTHRYVTALTDTLLSASPLEVQGRWCDVELVGLAYDEVESRSSRTLGAGFVEVSVTVPDALDPAVVVDGVTDGAGDDDVLVTDPRVTVIRRPLA